MFNKDCGVKLEINGKMYIKNTWTLSMELNCNLN